MITDTHIDISNSHPVQVNNIDKFFEFFWDYVSRHNLTHVLHLGDVVDNRTRISFTGINQLKRCIIDPVKKHAVDMHIIVGNHDVMYRSSNDISSATLFEGKEGISVYSSPKDITIPDGTVICMLPWINRENYKETCDHLEKTEAKIVMGHLEVKGALMMKGTASNHGQDASLFERFDAVYSGHYHHRNSYGNIHYIGNICQFNYGDYGEQRGFSILDTETGELEFIENPFSPFQKIYYNDEKNNYEDLSYLEDTDFKNLFVKVIVVEKKNPFFLERFVQKLNDLGAFNVTVVEHDAIEYSGDEVEAEDITEFKADTLTILSDYVTGTAISDEQAKRVQGILKELYAEAVSRAMVS